MTGQPNNRDRSRRARLLAALHPSHAHSAFSATVVLMISTAVSSLIGLVRTKYIAWLFGSGTEADAFNAAFVLPDMISYFLVGGAASITLVTLLTRYRDTGREAEGQRSLSVILSTMFLVLGGAVLVAEFLAPLYVRHMFNGFSPAKAALCVHLTRILLPAQLFFFAGGVFGSVLLVRRQFGVQAIAPIIYNLGTIAGGLLLVDRIGVSSLAVGTTAGAFFGPFLLNALFAHRAGTRYRPMVDWQDEGLREWVRLSLPLIAGVSLVTADTWIISHFASHTGGAVSIMNYAKRLFTAPIAVLAQAVGLASMPFFASQWARGKLYEFATGVADAVARVACLGLLAASMLIALARPLVEIIFVGGRFSVAECRIFAGYFAIFCVSMCLWSAQAIYARAFYAAGITWLPMIAGTIVTLVSLPLYSALDASMGTAGLAVASDIGIGLQTAALAVLLHQRRMVSLASIDYLEIGRCLLAACAAGAVVWLIFGDLYFRMAHLIHRKVASASRARDLAFLIAGSLLWIVIAKWVLERSGSALPRVALRRLKSG